MSNIKNIQFIYDTTEDRLILKFSTEDSLEVSFWITRKMLKVMWTILLRVEEIVSKEEEEDLIEREMAATKIQDGIQSREDSLSYMDAEIEAPFGKAPLLLTKFSASPSAQGGAHFHLEDNLGRSVELLVDGMTLSGLHQMIIRILPKTEWGLKFI